MHNVIISNYRAITLHNIHSYSREIKEHGKEGESKSTSHKFNFRSNTGGKKKKPRKAKRTSSMNEPRSREFQRREKELLCLMSGKGMGDSSEGSSIASGLGGSIPFDLPGVVGCEGVLRLGREDKPVLVCQRSNSGSSLGGISISLSHTHTADTGTQCDLGDPLYTTDTCLLPRLRTANAEHSRLLHSVHHHMMGGVVHSSSLPGSPLRKRRPHKHQMLKSLTNHSQSAVFSNIPDPPRNLYRNRSLGSGRDLLDCNNLMAAQEIEVRLGVCIF